MVLCELNPLETEMAFKMIKTVDVEARTVTFAAIGTDAEGNEKTLFSRVFDANKVKPEILLRLALHGASQKVGDSYAGAGADDVADPLAFTQECVEETIKQLEAGDWRVGATGGPRVSDLAVAIAQLTGKPIEEVSETLKTATDEQKKALRKDPRIAAAIAGIVAAKAAARAAKLAEGAEKAEGGLLDALSK